MKILNKVFYWLVIGFLILIAGVVAVSVLKIPGSYQLFAVQSGSMKPAVKMGSVVVVKQDREYKKDDIITFINPDMPDSSVTHRIFEIKDDDGRITFVVKGDANKEPDMKKVERSWILGKVILTIPYLGYPVSFAKTLAGLILLIIIPAVVIVFGELRKIKKIMNWRKIITFFSLFIFLFTGITNTFLADVETSANNVFAAANLDFSLSSANDFSPEVTQTQFSTRSISVENDGSLSFEYTIEATNFSGVLCSNLNLTANLDGSDVYSDLLQNFNYNAGVFSDPNDWIFTVTLNSDDSGLQNQTCTFDFVFNGSQISGSGFSDQETISNSVQSGQWTPPDNQAPQTTLAVSGSTWEINEKVFNGGFESGLTGWQTEGEVNLINSDIYEPLSYGGSNMVRIGHHESFGGEVIGDLVWENKLRQKISAGAKNISFYYNFYSFDFPGWDEPGMMVKINDVNVFWLGPGDLAGFDPASSGWRQFSFDLRGITDPVLEIIFYSGNTDGQDYQSWLYIDNISTNEVVAGDNTVFLLLAEDDFSGVDYSEYSFNGVHWTPGDTFKAEDILFTEGYVYFRSVDNTGNIEDINSRWVLKDIMVPSPITDLIAVSLSKNTVVLEWTAPDDDTQKAVVYDIRYSTSEIIYDSDFEVADLVANPLAPASPDSLESFEVTGLDSNTEYWFAIKSGDAVPNWSDISNVVSTTTWSEDGFIDPGDVVINELMWMGTSVSSADEYLELRNMTSQAIELTGWYFTILEAGFEELMAIDLSEKIISPHGYFLIANSNSYAGGESKINVVPDIWDASLELANSDLQIKLYDSFGILIDIADNGDGEPAMGDSAPLYYSMERNETPGNGEQAVNWHTCLADEIDLAVYWDSGFVEKGTPGGQNLSYHPKPDLEFFLREDKKAVGFKANNTAEYESLKYEIVYDTKDGDKGIASNIEINNRDNIFRENLVLGTCSGIEGKVCVYDNKITKIDLIITLIKETGEEKILEKDIFY